MYNQEREDMACLDEHEAINLKALVGGGGGGGIEGTYCTKALDKQRAESVPATSL